MTYYVGPSPAQSDTLVFIWDFIDTNEFPPTYREISDHFGGISTNAVNDRLNALERKGYIERPLHTAHSIRMTKKGREYLKEVHP